MNSFAAELVSQDTRLIRDFERCLQRVSGLIRTLTRIHLSSQSLVSLISGSTSSPIGENAHVEEESIIVFRTNLNTPVAGESFCKNLTPPIISVPGFSES